MDQSAEPDAHPPCMRCTHMLRMCALCSDQRSNAMAEGVRDQNGTGCITLPSKITIMSIAGV